MGALLVSLFWLAVKILVGLIGLCMIGGLVYLLLDKVAKKKNPKGDITDILPDFSKMEKKMDAKLEAIEKSSLRDLAQSGDMKAIIEFYGFTDNNVTSTAYAEILKALSNARSLSAKNEEAVKRLRDIVLYKLIDDDNAEQYFSSITAVEADYIRKYKLLRSLLEQNNIQEAEKTLRELEANGRLKIKPELLGMYYCRAGISYQNGSNGLGKDIKKAYVSYKKAVEDFKCTDAMLPLGVLLLSSEVDGVTIVRDYLAANDYISRAVQAGNADAKEIMDIYGVDGAILKPMSEAAVTYRFICGCELTAPVETIKYMQLLYGLRYKVAALTRSFSNEYSKQFATFSRLIDGIDKLYSDYITQMLNFGIRVLLSYGIDDYDVDAVISASGDLSLMSRTSSFQAALERIDSKAKQLNLDVAYAKATRSRWVGGGFGTTIGGTIKASIKGSIAAGAMNVGTGILYDIGGGIAKTISNSEIKDMEKRLFESKNTQSEFNNAVRDACSDISDAVRGILEEHSKIQFSALRGKIEYQGESFVGVDDRTLTSKINNNLTAGKGEYLSSLLLEKLRRNPLDSSTLDQLYQLALQSKDAQNVRVSDTLEQYAGDFGLTLHK